MSCNVRLAGFYVHANVHDLKKNGYKLNEDGTINTYFDKNNLKMWVPYQDIEGNFGFIYLIDYEWDSITEIEFYEVDLKKPSTKLLTGEYLEPKFFLINYYNGSDNPLTFK